MSLPGRTEFLDRGAYRQRRLRDAARVLPFFALVLMLVPLLWPDRDGAGWMPSDMLTYLFGVWAIFVGIWFLLSRRLRLELDQDNGDGTEPAGEARR